MTEPLTDRHMLVLWWLKDHPHDTPEDIALGLGAEVADVGTLCDELEAAGFITLSPSGRA